MMSLYLLASSTAWIPLYKELLKFRGGVAFTHLKTENYSSDYRTQSWLEHEENTNGYHQGVSKNFHSENGDC